MARDRNVSVICSKLQASAASRCYKLIGKFIDKNDGRNPKVPDIDQIVPLPPAKLPPWDGTFQWEKEQAKIPEKPSDELVNRLSKDKGLDRKSTRLNSSHRT